MVRPRVCEHFAERLDVFGALVTLEDRAGQFLVLQEHVEIAGLLRRPFIHSSAKV